MRWLLAAMLMSSVARPAFAQTAAEPAPAAAPASARVITYPASFFAPMGLDTAYDMVRRIPGFTFDDGSSARGFASAAGNVLIDGQRPASKTDDLSAILTRLPASQVERIDLIRGGAPGIDMQGKAAIANVIRRRASGFTGVMGVGQYTTVEGYTDPQTQLEGTWRSSDHTVEASLHTFKGHDNTWGSGPHEVLAPDGALTDLSNMHNSEPSAAYQASGAYESPLLQGRLRVNLTLEDQPLSTHSADDFQVAGHQSELVDLDQRDGELGLHYTRDLSTNLGMEILGLQHLNQTNSDSVFRTTTDDQQFHLADTGGESILRGVTHWRPLSTLNVDSGGEFAYNWLNTETTFTNNGAPVALPAANVRVREQRGEVYATTTWRVLSTLSIEAGARIEHSTLSSSGDVALTKTLVFPKPRLLVTWSLDAADQLRLRIEREVGQLDFNAFVAAAALNGSGVTAGNPNLTPQQDWAFEAAYERRFWNDGVLSLSFQHLILKDVIDRAPVFAASGVFDEPANIGGGVENDVTASFSVPLSNLGIQGATLRGQGTWRNSQVTDPTTGQERRISGQHPLDAEVHFNQDLPRWHMNWGVDFTYGFRERFYLFDEIDTNTFSDSTDVFVDYKPAPDLALRAQLIDRSRYDPTRAVFSGPRNLDPLQFTDFQDRRFGPILFLRLRKTLQ